MKKAVALKYPEGAIAPIITAKGDGLLAEKILLEAEKNNVEVVENTEIVNLLDSQNAGSIIPENTWEVVAVIFSYIIGLEESNEHKTIR